MSSTLELAMELIRRPSVTPVDAGCQALIAARLARLDFAIEPLPFGNVENLWTRRGGTKPMLVLAGHTDGEPVLRWMNSVSAGMSTTISLLV
jgi:succinyl-diaminopimelate desuccinylase